MARIADIVARMRRNPKDVRFFGEARQQSTSHRVYRTPWQGDPRVNIQGKRGKAKAYQVLQVLKAIDRVDKEDGAGK